jgi:putative transposase
VGLALGDHFHGIRRQRRIHHLDLRVMLAKVLTGNVALRVREMVRQTCELFEIKILQGVVSKDHVHILVSAPPHMALSEIMRRIKGRTSSKLFEEFPMLKKRYWGRHFWARGYFCATVG